MGKDSSRLTKSEKKVTNDALHSKVDVEFEIQAREVVNAHVPDSVLKEKSAETGVFYDLLPLGYVYNENEGVNVTSYTKKIGIVLHRQHWSRWKPLMIIRVPGGRWLSFM